MRAACFLLFLVSEKLLRNCSRNWKKQIARSLFPPTRHIVQTRVRGGPRSHHTMWWHRSLSAHRHMVWGPKASTDVAPSPIYTLSAENPKYLIIFPRKVPSGPSSSTLDREGSRALPDTLPEGRSSPEALHHHACLRSDV